jgi:hypothetical protein
MPNNRGIKNRVRDNNQLVDVIDITWSVTDPSGRWFAYVGETEEIALLKRLVSRASHPVNSGFKVDSWTYEIISSDVWKKMKSGLAPIPPRDMAEKSGLNPKNNKLQVLLIGGPRDGEKIYVPKSTKFLRLPCRTRDDFDTTNPIPLYVQAHYKKGDDGNFHYCD